MPTFDVPDMECDGCVRSITAAIGRVAPGAVVRADLARKRVEVDGAASAETLAEAMRDAGFSPEAAAAAA
jgi:copper chaperone